MKRKPHIHIVGYANDGESAQLVRYCPDDVWAWPSVDLWFRYCPECGKNVSRIKAKMRRDYARLKADESKKLAADLADAKKNPDDWIFHKLYTQSPWIGLMKRGEFPEGLGEVKKQVNCL